jgi:hypothetical protein
MGMHNSTDRMRKLISALTHFYQERHDQIQHRQADLEGNFDPDVPEYSSDDIDEPYYEYVRMLSEGVEEVCEQLGVELDPIPPGEPADASDELLSAGARMLKWNIEVHDRESGEFVGRLEWGLYHRHDRFSIPGPPQLTYLKARGGNTMIVG